MLETYNYKEGTEYVVGHPIINTGIKWYPVHKIQHHDHKIIDVEPSKYFTYFYKCHVILLDNKAKMFQQRDSDLELGVEYFATLCEAQEYCNNNSKFKASTLEYTVNDTPQPEVQSENPVPERSSFVDRILKYFGKK